MVTPGPPLVALRRGAVDIGSVVAVLVTVLVVCALVTGVVATLPTLQQQALRRAMQQLPAEEAAVTIVGSYDVDAAEDEDRAVRAALQPLVAVAGGTAVRQVETVAHREVGSSRTWSFTHVDGGPGVVSATEGRLPEPAGGTLEVAVPAGGPVAPGDRITLESPLDESRVQVTVVGTWRPEQAAGRALEEQALLVAPDALDRVAGRGSSVQWHAAPSAARIEPRHLDALIVATGRIETSVAAAAEATGASLRVENGLVGALEARGRELLAQRMLLLVPALILLLLGAASAMLVAAALAQNRRDGDWLMRSRGADRRQLVAPTLLEALALCVVGAAAGPVLASAVVRIGGVRPSLDATAWAAGVAAAAVCWAALVLPAVAAALSGDRGEQLSAEKRRRRSLTALIAAGLLMVALGVVATTRLEGFSATVASGWSGDVDPLLVAAPALLMLAVVSVLVLALVPLLFRLAERTVRSRGVALAVGTRAAARAPGKAVPLALAVALVAGGVTFASVERGSQEAARQARAAYDVGSDVRVSAPPTSLRAPVPEEREELAGLPGVADVSGVNRELEFVDDVAAELLVADLSGRVGQDLVAFTPDPRATLDRLADRADGGVPVAVTPDLVERASLDVGRSFELVLGGNTTTLTVAAVVPVLPTLGEGRAGMLVDRAVVGPLGPAVPDEWWLAVTDAEVEAVATALEQRPALAGRVLTRDRALERLAADPGTGGAALADVMAVTALGSVLLGAVLLVSVVVLRRRERDSQSSALRALGSSERDVTLTVATEYTLVTGGGLLAGAVAGVVTAAVAIGATALGAGGRPLVPAPELHVPWVSTLGLLAVLLVVPMLALLALTWSARRAERGRRPHAGDRA
ncbi:MAG TPA: FtsX-like permease family protein [Nocardioidaceae bacterium]